MKHIAFHLLLGFAATSSHAAIVSVNLTRSLPISPTVPTAPPEPGFTDWVTPDNSVPGNLLVAGLTLSAVDFNAGTTLRSIDRGGNDGYAGILPNLTRTWWGQRQSSTGPGGYITIDVSGLAAGTYSFTSWHLDHEDQTGGMKIEFSDNDGVSFIDAVSTFDLVSGNQGATAPVEQIFSFTSTGADVQFRFTNTNVDGAGSSGAFPVVNGFEIAEVVIPEPSSALLLGLGAAFGLLRRRR